jgi:hypothetical protein
LPLAALTGNDRLRPDLKGTTDINDAGIDGADGDGAVTEIIGDRGRAGSLACRLGYRQTFTHTQIFLKFSQWHCCSMRQFLPFDGCCANAVPVLPVKINARIAKLKI